MKKSSFLEQMAALDRKLDGDHHNTNFVKASNLSSVEADRRIAVQIVRNGKSFRFVLF
jgi:hypothetical protein